LSLFRKIVGDEKLQEIFFEYFLGQFDYSKNKWLVNNLTFVFGNCPYNFEEEALQWYEKTKKFATRLVGFRYHKERFVKIVHGEVTIKFKL